MKVKTNDIESIRHINTIMVLNELRSSDHLNRFERFTLSQASGSAGGR